MSNISHLACEGAGPALSGPPDERSPVARQRADDPLRTLERLAALLRRPPSLFFETEPPAFPPGTAEASETLDLVRLFLALKDPAVRAECLAFVRARAVSRNPRPWPSPTRSR